MSTDKARETIAEIVTSFIPKFIISSAQPHDAADAILAALPEIIRQNPSIIAGMVEPLAFEVRGGGGSLFCSPNEDGSAYTITQQSNRLVVRCGPSIIDTCDDWSVARNSANTHRRATILKAIGMGEGE